jgi:creatinine amidohydrolase/Fe(II)-dependent formamide hydrolase-like protein
VRHACEAETSMVLALAPDLVGTCRLADAVALPQKKSDSSSGPKPTAGKR